MPSATPWLTVVTVVKDAPGELGRTAASLASQDLDGVEYVVIDSSRDRAESVAALNVVPHRYLWVEPRGIYAAMNRGLREATGDYVYYANAGDHLRADDVVTRVGAELARTRPVWAYGEVEIVHEDQSRVVTPRWDYSREKAAQFSNGRFPPHQGTFVQRDALLAIGGFDERYSIVADYVAFLRLAQLADPTYLDLVVATFAEGGVSTRRWPESLRQFHRARREVLRPRGWDAVREYSGTLRQAVAMAAYRGVLSRARRP